MQYGPDIDHRQADLSIYKMVRNRLPWIKDTPENEKIISNFTLELMYQLNPCFSVEEDMIGNEKNYTVIMQAIIADVICIFMLMSVMSGSLAIGNEETTSEGSGGQQQGTFLKSAKAGSVEVEYEEYSSEGSGSGASSSYVKLKLTAPEQITLFKNDAISKAGTLGCYLSIFDDGSLSVGCMCSNKPFMVVPY